MWKKGTKSILQSIKRGERDKVERKGGRVVGGSGKGGGGGGGRGGGGRGGGGGEWKGGKAVEDENVPKEAI